MDWPLLWERLIFPLLRLLLVMSLGMLLANVLEAMHWTRFIAKLSAPLTRLGHMGESASAAFALAFFSPSSSNGILSEALQSGKITRRELVFANLFNSTPAYLVHLPSLFMLAFSFLGPLAFVYIGLTFLASCLRTCGTALAGRFFLPPPEYSQPAKPEQTAKTDWRATLQKTLKRLKRRIWRMALLTVPVYCAFFAMAHFGWFTALETFMAQHLGFLSFLKPEALSISAIYIAAENGAALSAAAALAYNATLTPQEIVLALMVGNILSSPIRAARHQFPSYAGFFAPATALLLVIMNQLLRAISLILVTWGYYLLAN